MEKQESIHVDVELKEYQKMKSTASPSLELEVNVETLKSVLCTEGVLSVSSGLIFQLISERLDGMALGIYQSEYDNIHISQ